MRETVGKLGAAPWGLPVLTLPLEVQDRIMSVEHLRAWSDLSWRISASWLTRWAFRGERVRLGGVAVVHPCGSDESAWKPHFNVIVPLAGMREDGSRRVGRWKLPPEALDDLRRRWAEALRRICGYQGPVNVFYEWVHETDQARKAHHARYIARGFPGWKASTHRVTYRGILTRESPWKDVPAEVPVSERAVSHCPICGTYMTTVSSLRVSVGGHGEDVFDGDRSLMPELASGLDPPLR